MMMAYVSGSVTSMLGLFMATKLVMRVAQTNMPFNAPIGVGLFAVSQYIGIEAGLGQHRAHQKKLERFGLRLMDLHPDRYTAFLEDKSRRQ